VAAGSILVLLAAMPTLAWAVLTAGSSDDGAGSFLTTGDQEARGESGMNGLQYVDLTSLDVAKHPPSAARASNLFKSYSNPFARPDMGVVGEETVVQPSLAPQVRLKRAQHERMGGTTCPLHMEPHPGQLRIRVRDSRRAAAPYFSGCGIELPSFCTVMACAPPGLKRT
jgi:hypothetical protein